MADDDIRRLDRDIGVMQGELRALQGTVNGVETRALQRHDDVIQRLDTISTALSGLRENNAMQRGGWLALSGLLGLAATIGAGLTWFIKTVISTPN